MAPLPVLSGREVSGTTTRAASSAPLAVRRKPRGCFPARASSPTGAARPLRYARRLDLRVKKGASLLPILGGSRRWTGFPVQWPVGTWAQRLGNPWGASAMAHAAPSPDTRVRGIS